MLIGVLVVAVLVGVFLLIPWFAQRMQDLASDSSGGTGMFQVLEEVFHPAAHRAQLVQEKLSEQPATAPVPGDDPDPGDEADDHDGHRR